MPFGGPYCRIGRYIGCCGGGGGGGGRTVVSLTEYMIASNVWGSIIIQHVPILVIVSLAGFPGGSSSCPFCPLSFFGLVQYRSNMPSVSHLCFDRDSDSAKTPL
jgi:hypothetical protein